MASALYPDYKESCLGGGTHSFSDLTSDVIKCALVSVAGADYTYSTTHADKADVTSYSGTTDQTLTSGNISVTDGVFDCTDDLTYTSVAIDGAKVVDTLVHYKFDTGDSTSPLMCIHDGFSAITPNNGNITVSYNVSGIYEL